QNRTALALPFSLWLTALAAGQGPPAAPRIVPYPIDLSPAFQAAIANGTRTTTGRPGPKYWTNHTAYTLTAELDPAAARLQGRAVMTYHNRSPAELDRLVVHLYQNLMKAGAERTRTVVPTDGFEIADVRLGGVQVKPQVRDRSAANAEGPTRTIRDTLLTVRLPEPLAAGAKATLEIDYAFSVPRAGTAPRMGHENDNVFYLGYWYPQFAVYDDVNGWVADQHRGNGEFYMGYADYDLAITVPVGYLVRATGELQNADEVLTPKARDALAAARTDHEIVHVVDKEDLAAGNATAKSETGRLTWRFRAESVRDAAVSIAKTYLWDATHAVIADKDGPGRNGTAMIHTVYEANSGDWVRAARYAQHTIEYMSAHVHPYPWPHMTACEGIIGGGMEYPMMTICGGRQPAGVIAHELIHMWFPMLVGSNEKRYAWQDEGFTSFWTTLCRGDFTGARNGPQREILAYAATVQRGGDASCMRHADTYGDDNFGFASYGKPAAILHQLRAMLGDETFFAAFRRYAADWAWKHPYPHDFFRTFSDVAGRDLEPYFRTWFFETWQLDHAVGSVESKDGKTLVSIEDRGRAVHPAVVEVTYRDERKERQTVAADSWWASTQVVLTFGPDVVAVQIDPDTASLDCDRKNNSWSQKQ
ncbi:MAG TPA: M1 family metallopeptidase, partial [Planctomycetota bacterium]|nr:M1 family metallopeptidase [Planctomycetota bacterium]